MLNTLYGQLAVNFEHWPIFGQCSTAMSKVLGDIFGTQPGSVPSTMTNANRRMDAILAATV